MLIATLLALSLLLFGGDSVASLFDNLGKKEVKEAVSDEDVRDRILALSEQLGDDLHAGDKDWQDLVEGLVEIQQDYDSSRADLEAQAEKLHAPLKQRHETVRATRSQMKALLDETEWNALFAER